MKVRVDKETQFETVNLEEQEEIPPEPQKLQGLIIIPQINRDVSPLKSIQNKKIKLKQVKVVKYQSMKDVTNERKPKH